MSEKLVIGRKYIFAQISTSAVTMSEGAKQTIAFHENNILWTSEYHCVHHKEENDNTGIKGDAPRNHKWCTVIPKDNIAYPEWYLWEMENQYVVKLYMKYGNDIIITFSSEEKAVKMYSLMAQYIGIETY